jgi:hypothetical protein
VGSHRPPLPVVPGYADLVEVGRGGFARVYRARQLSLDSVVALKVLGSIDLDGVAGRRFVSECQALGQLRWHPFIVVVHDAGVTSDGTPYIAMEHLEGGSLADRLDEDGPLPWPEVATIGVQLAGALEAAHRADPPILHRDIKPENVLVGRFGEAKLSDFGIAAIAGSNRTSTGLVTGTLAHVAPELLAGARASFASDIYSLGSTLFMLLVGQPAFVEATDEAVLPILSRVISLPVPDLRPLGIPDELATLVEQAMAKQPDQRPASAAALGLRLAELQRAHGHAVTDMRLPDPTTLEARARVVPSAAGAAIPERPRTTRRLTPRRGGAPAPQPETVRPASPPVVPMVAPAMQMAAPAMPMAAPAMRHGRGTALVAAAVAAIVGVVIVLALTGPADDGEGTETEQLATSPTAIATSTTTSAETLAPEGQSGDADEHPLGPITDALESPGGLGPIIGAIDAPGGLDTYTFMAEASQALYFDVDDTGYECGSLIGLWWSLHDDSDDAVFEDEYYLCDGTGPWELPGAGSYTLTIQAADDWTGEYAFTVYGVREDRFTVDVGDTVGPGEPRPGAGAIESPGGLDTYTFTAEAGQRLYFDVDDTGYECGSLIGLSWSLHDERNDAVFEDEYYLCDGTGPWELPITGSYTLSVDPFDDWTGEYAFTVYAVRNDQITVNVGDRVLPGEPQPGAGAIESPGGLDTYTFSAEAGQRLTFDVDDAAIECPPLELTWALHDAQGIAIFENETLFICTDQGPFELSATGSYTLTVDPTADWTGEYSFTVRAA